MNVTAIIVNYYTSSFLPPLLKILDNESAIHKIVIADNSSEHKLQDISSKYNKVSYHDLESNIGFAAAINKIAQNYVSDFYLLINPDTLPREGFIEKLLDGLERTNALIAGPRYYWDDENTYKLPPAIGNSWWMQTAIETSNANKLDKKLLQFYWDLRFERFWKETEAFYEPFLSGACLLIKNDKTFFTDNKIFDHRFFLYYEDTDLCAKAMIEDKLMVCVPDAYVVHYWNQSPSDNKNELMGVSHNQYFEKYYPDLSNNNIIGNIEDGNFFDLGTVNDSPIFENGSFDKYPVTSFEIGVNKSFIPFAQTEMNKPNIKIPDSIWQKMSLGNYFARIRNQYNNEIAAWKWKKQ